jgi:hypothetical protein
MFLTGRIIEKLYICDLKKVLKSENDIANEHTNT